jgi:hypothetical protein
MSLVVGGIQCTNLSGQVVVPQSGDAHRHKQPKADSRHRRLLTRQGRDATGGPLAVCNTIVMRLKQQKLPIG